LFCTSKTSSANCRQSMDFIFSARLTLIMTEIELTFSQLPRQPFRASSEGGNRLRRPRQQRGRWSRIERLNVSRKQSLDGDCLDRSGYSYANVSARHRQLAMLSQPPSHFPSPHSQWLRICFHPNGNSARSYPCKCSYQIRHGLGGPLDRYPLSDRGRPILALGIAGAPKGDFSGP
jgi:hypothetical protein